MRTPAENTFRTVDVLWAQEEYCVVVANKGRISNILEGIFKMADHTVCSLHRIKFSDPALPTFAYPITFFKFDNAMTIANFYTTLSKYALSGGRNDVDKFVCIPTPQFVLKLVSENGISYVLPKTTS